MTAFILMIVQGHPGTHQFDQSFSTPYFTPAAFTLDRLYKPIPHQSANQDKYALLRSDWMVRNLTPDFSYLF